MKLLIDFFPIVLFFVTFKLYGIYAATGAAIVAAIGQVAFFWFKHRRVETMHLITLLVIVILGGATLFLHNEWFIKWKPTAINWAFGLVFLASQFIGKKNLIQRMMDKNIELPMPVWQRLNMSWVIFFTSVGFLNLYVIYHFDTNTWVNFKLFGILGLTVLFVIVQAIYLSRHVSQNHTS